jgi:hypothetical protein
MATPVRPISMRAAAARLATAGSSSNGTPSRCAFQPIARYMAPLS